MGKIADFTVVSERVRLDVGEGLFVEVGGQRALADEKFIGAAGVLQADPRIIAGWEAQSRLEQVAVLLRIIGKRSRPTPKRGACPMAVREGPVVHHGGGGAG